MVTHRVNARRRQHLPRIRGGIELPRIKPGLDSPIIDVPTPEKLVFPLIGHRGRPVQTQVAIGQSVIAGTALADGIVASAGGRISAIDLHPAAHPSGIAVPSVILDVTDTVPRRAEPSNALIDALRAAGIVGHGGAGFTTANKIAKLAGHCTCLVINAAECEPGIACDEALLLHDTDATVYGISALIDGLQPDTTLIAIESDKVRAITMLEKALGNETRAEVLRIQPVYPSGAERALVDLVLHRQRHPPLNATEIATDRGVICLNLATAHAVGQVAQGHVITHRVITVNGSSPCHARVARGTPIRHVLDYTDNLPDSTQRLRIGGPLSGFDVSDDATPVSTVVNAITVTKPPQHRVAHACIRCGDGVPVCPSGLFPLLLYELADKDTDLDRHGLDRCITCGCCDIVCPSQIPLTATFRKALLRRDLAAIAARDAKQAELLNERHRARLARDMQRKPVEETTPAEDGVAAALKRARERRDSAQ